MEDVAESLLRSGKICRRRFQIVDLPRGPPQAFVVEFNRHALKIFEARSSICCGGQRIGGGSPAEEGSRGGRLTGGSYSCRRAAAASRWQGAGASLEASQATLVVKLMLSETHFAPPQEAVSRMCSQQSRNLQKPKRSPPWVVSVVGFSLLPLLPARRGRLDRTRPLNLSIPRLWLVVSNPEKLWGC